MPLKTGISRETFSHNVSEEMRGGRRQDQALAIAYAKKREAERRKKLWQGGEILARHDDEDIDEQAEKPMPIAGAYAFGGEVADDLQDDDLEAPGDHVQEDGYQPGETTRHVMPESDTSPGSQFHQALRRRQRRFRPD